nr:EOG090X048D [Lepidurus arcticus]
MLIGADQPECESALKIIREDLLSFPERLVQTYQDGYDKVKSGDYAFIGSEALQTHLIDGNYKMAKKCETTIAKHTYSRSCFCFLWGYEKDSILTELTEVTRLVGTAAFGPIARDGLSTSKPTPLSNRRCPCHLSLGNRGLLTATLIMQQVRSEEARSSGNFVCQRCQAPLVLDSSFAKLDELTVAELSLPAVKPPDLNYELHQNTLNKFIPPTPSSGDEPLSGHTNGFIFIDNPMPPTNGSLSNHLRMLAGLFDLVSNTSDIDHPLCEECVENLIALMDQHLQFNEEECEDYRRYLKEAVEKAADVKDSDVEQLEKELKDLELEENELRQELDSLKTKRDTLETAIQSEESEKERLLKEEERFIKQYCLYRRQLMQAEDDCQSLEFQLSHSQSQLERLKQTNAFNATFHIWHAGHFGTINGLRLGRLPFIPVDWAEINAAWGQTALLLQALTNRMGIVLQRYRIIPFGSQSTIEDTIEQKTYTLYGSSGFRFLWDSRFDAGMVAFLDCLQQFQVEVERFNFQLPYRMEKGKLEDRTTRQWIQFNSEEHWTKAMKFMLTNLKWGLAWVSSQATKSDDSPGLLKDL